MDRDRHLARDLEPEQLRERGLRITHDPLLVDVLLVPPRRVAQQIVRIAGAQRADDDVVHRVRVLDDAELAEATGRDAQLSDGLAASFDQSRLELGIDPGAGDDPRAVPGPRPGELLSPVLEGRLVEEPPVDQRARERTQESRVLADVPLERSDPFFETALVVPLRDPEELVVVAALLPRVLDDGT